MSQSQPQATSILLPRESSANTGPDGLARPLICLVLCLTFLLLRPRTGIAGEPSVLNAHRDAVYSVAFSPDGKLLASGSYDQTIKIWDLKKRKVLATLEGHDDQIYRIAFSPDGKRIASSSADGLLKIWRVTPPSLQHSCKGHLGPVLTLAFAPDGKRIATGGFDATVRLWDTVTAKQVEVVSHPAPVYSVNYSHHDPAPHDDAPSTRRPQATSPRLATGDARGGIQIRSSKDLAVEQQWRFGKGVIYQLVFTERGRALAAVSSSGKLAVWKLPNSKQIASVQADNSALFCLALSPDGQQVACGGRDRAVRIWRTSDLSPLRNLRGPKETILTVAFSADGKQLAAGSYDALIHLWNNESR